MTLLLSATITIDVPYYGGDGELDVEVRGFVSLRTGEVEFLAARHAETGMERGLSSAEERRACVALLETAWDLRP